MGRISSLSEEFNRLYVELERPESPAALSAREGARSVQLEGIQIEPVDGYVLRLLLQLHGSQKVVEFGTLTGFSASHILSALPATGFLWTLEKESRHAELARKTLAPYTGRFEILEGDARLSMEKLSASGPFDAVFIDANKAAYLDYALWAEAHVRSGGLLIADNILLHGELFGAIERFSEKQRQVMWQMLRHLESSPNWELTIVPASDGFAVARRL